MKKIGLLFLVLISFIGIKGQREFPFQNPTLSVEERVDDLLSRMTLEEKVSQMQDVSPAIERLGVVEYNWWNECLHGVARAGAATSFPQAIGMASTWNVPLIHEVADVISTEARAKFNLSVAKGQRHRYQGLTMWTPNINIFRDPRWGRGQETYGEDPFLTSQLAVAFVTGLQGDDPDYFKVIATPKHFAVHSGPEHNRHSFDAYTDKRDLWETYLPAFKAAVMQGGAFSVMSAYNRYLGASASASPLLLTEVLRHKWGFQGYVVSDCGAISDIYKFHKIVDTAEEAAALGVKAGCDLNCGDTYSHLVSSVEQGLITECDIDVAVRRLLMARFKLGLFNPSGEVPFSELADGQLESEDHQALALKTARESVVLLKNSANTLPLSRDLKSIAVIGPNANDRHFAMGNYFGTPTHKTTLREGIQKQVSPKTDVHYFKGTNLTDEEALLDVIEAGGFAGKIKTEYFDNVRCEGEPVFVSEEELIDFEWGGAAPMDLLNPGRFSVRYTGVLKPDFSGGVNLTVQTQGGEYAFWVNGDKVSPAAEEAKEDKAFKLEFLNKHKKVPFKLEYFCTNPWVSSIQLMWDKEESLGKQLMWETINQSDVIIYAGGITARLEGEEMPVDVEGFFRGDRTNLKMPRVQEDLLQALHATGKPVILVLTSGSAMSINWEQEHLAAILNVWYPGQAGGEALGEILFGDYNPSGRLPVTFYHSVEDLPPFEDYHMKGRTYRFFEGEVLYPFGYGLSYTNFTYSKPQLNAPTMAPNGSNRVHVTVANTGAYDGETVVQMYIADQESSVARPLRTLRGFQKVFLKKGESREISFDITPADLSITDSQGNPFVEPGVFEVTVGENSASMNKTELMVER